MTQRQECALHGNIIITNQESLKLFAEKQGFLSVGDGFLRTKHWLLPADYYSYSDIAQLAANDPSFKLFVRTGHTLA